MGYLLLVDEVDESVWVLLVSEVVVGYSEVETLESEAGRT
jgi:hypothetical protein